MSILYRHIRLDTNMPFYIGIGKTVARAYSKQGRNRHWHNITKKVPYEIEILLDSLTVKEAQEKEKEFIKLYGRTEYGGLLCNETDGGEWNKEIADARRGKKIPWQKQMAEARKGTKRGNLFRKKISAANLLRDKSVYDSVANKHRGMKRSDIAKQNMSFAKQAKKLFGYLVSGYSSIIVNTKKINGRYGEA